MYCSKCGSKLEDDIRYCPNCGNKLIKPKIKRKPNVYMIIVVIINIIMLLLNLYLNSSSIIENIGAKEYSISTSSYGSNPTLKINERIIDKAINQLQNNGLTVFNKMYVVYSYNQAKQYVVIAEYSSKYSNIKGFDNTFGLYYLAKAIDAKTGNITDINLANKEYGIEYIVTKALDSEKIVDGNIGSFNYKEDYKKEDNNSVKSNTSGSGQGYVFMAIIIMLIGGICYWRYKKTKRISSIISVIGTICIITQIFIIIPSIQSIMYKSTSDTEDSSSNVNVIIGTYTDKGTDSEEYGHGYSVYDFTTGNVKYVDEGREYHGTYTIEGNRLLITYYEAYELGEPVKLDILKDEFIIKNKRTLVTLEGVEFIKE